LRVLRRALPRCLALVFLATLTPAAAAQSPTIRWYLIVTDEGARIGHASRETRPRAGAREIVESHVLLLQEPGQRPARIEERTITREDAAGRPVSIIHEMGNGRNRIRTEASISGAMARIARTSDRERRQIEVLLPPGTRFDDGAGLLPDWDRATPLEFNNFSLSGLGIEHVLIAPARGAVVDEAGRLAVVRRRYEGSQLRSVGRLLIDLEGRIVDTAQPMFGTAVSLRPTDQATALRNHAPYSALRGALVRSPFRISDGAARNRIRYRFGFRHGIDFPLPQTPEQRVTPTPDGIVLEICNGCGPGLEGDESLRADALRPALWLQSDHPRLRAIAAPVARQRVTDDRRMAILAERVRGLLPRIDFVGHYSALDALSRGAGDCTESAVLLAALGRAAGIPTKVASGLVYSRERYHGVSNVFMPHSWVLAYVDGEWRSYDAALDGFDATHIALTIGDGDPRSIAAASQLAGLLEWREMSEVRRASAQ
jgi:transglutaminase-like putative cysteine protease